MKNGLKTVIGIMIVMTLVATLVSAQARFDSVSMDPPYIQAGDDVNVYVKFHEGLNKREIYSVSTSKGGEKLPVGENADVSYIARLMAKDDATNEYILIKEGDRNVGHLFTGESWTTPFQVHVADDAPATNYTLSFELLKTTIKSPSDGEVILSQDIQVEVSGTPKFTIDSDSEMKAGETKKFKVMVSNVGGGVAKQVMVNLNATAPLTVLRSSSVYVGDMEGGAEKDVSYDLYADSKANPMAYTVPVEIKYTDRSGVQQTVAKVVGVKVQGMPQVSANIDSFDDMKAAMSGKVTINVANKGFVEAKFLTLSIADMKDYTVTGKNDVYIGNLASDDFQTEDFKIKVADGVSGKIPVNVRVSYTEENNNQVHEEQQTLFINVLPADEYDKLHPTSNGTTQVSSYIMLIPALVVAYIVLWLIMKIVGAVTGFIDRKVFRKQ